MVKIEHLFAHRCRVAAFPHRPSSSLREREEGRRGGIAHKRREPEREREIEQRNRDTPLPVRWPKSPNKCDATPSNERMNMNGRTNEAGPAAAAALRVQSPAKQRIQVPRQSFFHIESTFDIWNHGRYRSHRKRDLHANSNRNARISILFSKHAGLSSK